MNFFKAKVAVMAEMHQMPVERIAVPIVAASVAVAEPVAVPVAKQPVPIPERSIDAEAMMCDETRASYISLAAELGIMQPGLLKDAAFAYFRDRGTRLYDRVTVKAFLDDQYGNEIKVQDHRFSGQVVMRGRPTWGWRALRKQDIQPVSTQQSPWGYITPEKNGSIWAYDSYNKPLPLPVLLTVKEVVEKFPSAHFYVSDEIKSHEHRDPVLDPFLMVVIEDEPFIIERWDEPAYRE